MAAGTPSLGARIRRAREQARLSQEELAKAVGASVRAVGDWENDRRKPRNRLGALEQVLGVSLSGEPPPASPVPPDVLALIRRRFPPDKQQEAIEALEDILAPPTESGEGDRTDPSRPSRRAS